MKKIFPILFLLITITVFSQEQVDSTSKHKNAWYLGTAIAGTFANSSNSNSFSQQNLKHTPDVESSFLLFAEYNRKRKRVIAGIKTGFSYDHLKYHDAFNKWKYYSQYSTLNLPLIVECGYEKKILLCANSGIQLGYLLSNQMWDKPNSNFLVFARGGIKIGYNLKDNLKIAIGYNRAYAITPLTYSHYDALTGGAYHYSNYLMYSLLQLELAYKL